MTQYHVVPDGKTWTVETEIGATVSQGHRTKNGAVQAMNRAASPGDTKYYHGRQGTILDVREHR